MKEEFENLKSRIWKTYKCRIIAAERLKINNTYLSFFSIYYSAILSGVSILNYSCKSEIIDVFSIVLSIMVTIIFLFFEGKSYKERHEKMKMNYNDIYILYYNLLAVTKDENLMTSENFIKFTEEYADLLNNVENHKSVDYLMYRITTKDDVNIWKYIKYILYNIFINFSIKLVIFMLPTTFLIITILNFIGIINIR